MAVNTGNLGFITITYGLFIFIMLSCASLKGKNRVVMILECKDEEYILYEEGTCLVHSVGYTMHSGLYLTERECIWYKYNNIIKVIYMRKPDYGLSINFSGYRRFGKNFNYSYITVDFTNGPVSLYQYFKAQAKEFVNKHGKTYCNDKECCVLM